MYSLALEGIGWFCWNLTFLSLQASEHTLEQPTFVLIEEQGKVRAWSDSSGASQTSFFVHLWQYLLW